MRTSPQKRSGMDHPAFTLQIHHTRLSPRKRSRDVATMASDWLSNQSLIPWCRTI